MTHTKECSLKNIFHQKNKTSPQFVVSDSYSSPDLARPWLWTISLVTVASTCPVMYNHTFVINPDRTDLNRPLLTPAAVDPQGHR